jgi:hypothetical protein
MAAPLVTDPLDVLLDANNDPVIVNGDIVFARGVPAVAQLIRVVVQMIAGEWFLNLLAGIPYLANASVDESEALLGPRFDPVKTRAAFRTAILGVPGVASLDTLDVSFEPRTRTLYVSWVVITAFGDSIADSLSKMPGS